MSFDCTLAVLVVQVFCNMNSTKNKSEKAINFIEPKAGHNQGQGEFLKTLLESLLHPFYIKGDLFLSISRAILVKLSLTVQSDDY